MWLASLACVAVLFFVFFSRAQNAHSRPALARIALLHGVVPLRGESDESLRRRGTAASRWPYSHPEPQFVWWERAWRRLVGTPPEKK